MHAEMGAITFTHPQKRHCYPFFWCSVHWQCKRHPSNWSIHGHKTFVLGQSNCSWFLKRCYFFFIWWIFLVHKKQTICLYSFWRLYCVNHIFDHLLLVCVLYPMDFICRYLFPFYSTGGWWGEYAHNNVGNRVNGMASHHMENMCLIPFHWLLSCHYYEPVFPN
jgi:hypothetical protein